MILTTADLEQGRETLDSLAAQTVAERIEVLLIASPGSIDEDEAARLGDFHSLRVIEVDPRSSTARARAAGVAAARAPAVVMAETHCFPLPEWAEALIAAHRGPWAGVGPVFENANPGAKSWANLFIDYGAWIAPHPGGPDQDLAGHNSSYKRAALLGYGDELESWFEAESVLHWDLRARGERLYVEPRAKVRHVNVDRPIPAAIEHFYNGRCFGAGRSRGWHPARRALYAIGSPLVPLIRFGRILRHLRRSGRTDLLPGILPMMLLSLITHASGEMTGYVAGTGDALSAISTYELDRDLYLSGADCAAAVRPKEKA